MNKRAILLVSGLTILLVFLFAMGYKSSMAEIKTSTKQSEVIFDLNIFKTDSKKKLPHIAIEGVNKLEEELSSSSDPTIKLRVLESLIQHWDSNQNYLISGDYALQAAKLDPSEKRWMAAGNRFYESARVATDSLSKSFALGNSQQAYSEVLKINSNNIEAKNNLAVSYIEGSGEVMKAVPLLREVLAKDSNNLQALYTLGILSIQSGQWDKAEIRFQRLIKIDPFNADYYYYLAQTYEKMGNADKAIQNLEIAKSLTTNKVEKENIDNIIKQLKNI